MDKEELRRLIANGYDMDAAFALFQKSMADPKKKKESDDCARLFQLSDLGTPRLLIGFDTLIQNGFAEGIPKLDVTSFRSFVKTLGLSKDGISAELRRFFKRKHKGANISTFGLFGTQAFVLKVLKGMNVPFDESSAQEGIYTIVGKCENATSVLMFYWPPQHAFEPENVPARNRFVAALTYLRRLCGSLLVEADFIPQIIEDGIQDFKIGVETVGKNQLVIQPGDVKRLDKKFTIFSENSLAGGLLTEKKITEKLQVSIKVNSDDNVCILVDNSLSGSVLSKSDFREKYRVSTNGLNPIEKVHLAGK